MKIQYVGELLDHSGYGIAGRTNVALLHKMGHTIKSVPIGAQDTSDNEWKMQLIKDTMKTEMDKPDVIIAHIYPPQGMAKYKIEGVPLIGYIAWETDMLPSIWTYHLNKNCDMVVTTCHEMANVFKKSGVSKPVHVLGPTIFEDAINGINTDSVNIDDLPPGLKRIYNPDKFIFYSVFQWIERKDPRKLVAAFIQEFDNTEDDVMLLMKAYRLDYSKAEVERLINSINTINKEMNIIYVPEVRLIPHMLTEDEMELLHRMGTCYVSPHRGEGTGLGIIDAIMHENPVITTPYGGPQDYTKPEDTRWLKYNMIPIQNPLYCYNYFNAYMNWADVDIMDLRQAMRFMYENRNVPKSTKLSGRSVLDAKDHLLDVYSFTANSTAFDNILKEVTS